MDIEATQVIYECQETSDTDEEDVEHEKQPVSYCHMLLRAGNVHSTFPTTQISDPPLFLPG